MAGRQIHDVDVIPNAGSVGRSIVVAPHVEPLPASDGDLRDKGDKIVRDAFRVLANLPLSWAPTGLK